MLTEVQPLRRCLPEIIAGVKSTLDFVELRARCHENKYTEIQLRKERIKKAN